MSIRSRRTTVLRPKLVSVIQDKLLKGGTHSALLSHESDASKKLITRNQSQKSVSSIEKNSSDKGTKKKGKRDSKKE